MFYYDVFVLYSTPVLKANIYVEYCIEIFQNHQQNIFSSSSSGEIGKSRLSSTAGR